MGASIYARQVKPQDGISINANAPSSFMDSLDRAFGSFPVTLNSGAVPVLQGMGAVFGRDDSENPYYQLVRLIEELGEVEVYSVY